jgi:hypothetical protein
MVEFLQLLHSDPFWMAAAFQLTLFFTDSYTDLIAPVVFLITPWHCLDRQHTIHSRILTVSVGTCLLSHFLAAVVCSFLLRICFLAADFVLLSVLWPLPRNRCFQSRLLATAVTLAPQFLVWKCFGNLIAKYFCC